MIMKACIYQGSTKTPQNVLATCTDIIELTRHEEGLPSYFVQVVYHTVVRVVPLKLLYCTTSTVSCSLDCVPVHIFTPPFAFWQRSPCAEYPYCTTKWVHI